MDKYLEAEKKLAEAMGWKNLREVPMYAQPGRRKWLKGNLPDGTYGLRFPDYCRDTPLAFKLMMEHDCYPRESVGMVTVDNRDWKPQDRESKPHRSCVYVSDHPDKETAVRYAIVQAVIHKLTHRS